VARVDTSALEQISHPVSLPGCRWQTHALEERGHVRRLAYGVEQTFGQRLRLRHERSLASGYDDFGELFTGL